MGIKGCKTSKYCSKLAASMSEKAFKSGKKLAYSVSITSGEQGSLGSVEIV
jgi:hypothetical protein